MTTSKSAFVSWTFWFGVLQIVFGGIGYLTGWMDQGQAITLIGTGMGTLGLRFKTTQPITLS